MQLHVFNHTPSTWMHIDLNSCFATIEQQANPFLRGKPIAIAASKSDRGCILAPSIEAKRFGVKTGMRVFEGKIHCPHLLVLDGDPAKYRFVNQKLTQLLQEYAPHVSVRSIDEMVLNFAELPILKTHTMHEVGNEIKHRIKAEIGEHLTVSIGIATNPYLAKVGAGIHKPDGLDEINKETIIPILKDMKLVDLPYIKERNALRLARVGIRTAIDFYEASPSKLRSAFASVVGDYWYLRLHGFPVDEVDWGRKSIGHSYHLIRFSDDFDYIATLLCKLVEKMGKRIRKNEFVVRGLWVSCIYVDGTHAGERHTFSHTLYSNQDLFIAATGLLRRMQPLKKVRILAVSSFNLEKNLYNQLQMFSDTIKEESVTRAQDTINNRWGDFTIMPARMMSVTDMMPERIAFGKVHDMKELELQTTVTN